MPEQLSSFTFGARLRGSIADLRPAVEAALKAEGFGVLTEIDVQATLKKKLDVDREPFLILGACNPKLANAVTALAPEIGSILPCNVVLRAEGDGTSGITIIEAFDPRAGLSMAGKPSIDSYAESAREGLWRAVAAVEAEAGVSAEAGAAAANA